MPRIYQQAKTFFAPLRYIVAASLSAAFATSAFAQVIQPRQAEAIRSKVSPLSHGRTNGNRDTKVCADADVKRYVSKLGTSNLTNAEFEALVSCSSQAVPALSQVLKSDHSEVRISAAYALGQIGSASDAAVPVLITTLEDEYLDVRILTIYALGQIGIRAETSVPALRKVYIKSDYGEDLKVPLEYCQTCKAVAQALPQIIGKKQARSELFGLEKARKSNNFANPFLVQKKIQGRTTSNLPLICQLPGVKNVLPRCR